MFRKIDRLKKGDLVQISGITSTMVILLENPNYNIDDRDDRIQILYITAKTPYVYSHTRFYLSLYGHILVSEVDP